MIGIDFELGEVCLVKRGTTITQKDAVDGEIPVVAGGLKPTYYHNQSNRESGTITISGSGANAGFINFWKQPIFASDCSTVETKDKKIDITYVYYFLLSKQQYIYKELRSGAAQPHVYSKDIAKLTIQVPSLLTQQKIVAKLDKIFTDIDKATDAAEANVKNAESLFQCYLKDDFNKMKKIYGQKSIKYFCEDIFAGGDVPIDSFSKIKTEKYSIPIIANAFKYNGLYGYTNKPRVIKPSITIAGRGSGTGHTEIRREPFFPIVRLIVLTPNCSLIKLNFLYYAVLSLKILSSGSAIPQLTIPMIESYFLPNAPINEQKKLINKIESVFKETNKLKLLQSKKIKELLSLKKSIIQQAFSGKLVKAA